MGLPDGYDKYPCDACGSGDIELHRVDVVSGDGVEDFWYLCDLCKDINLSDCEADYRVLSVMCFIGNEILKRLPPRDDQGEGRQDDEEKV